MNRKKRVVIIDGETIALPLKLVIEGSNKFMVVGIYNEYAQVCKKFFRDLPDVVVLNISLDDHVTGIETIQYIKGHLPHVEVLVLSKDQTASVVKDSFTCGAGGFILKDGEVIQKIVEFLEHITSGGSPISPVAARQLVEALWINPFSPLTNRETEVMTLILRGNTYTEIGKSLSISKETSKTHIKNIYKKLKVESKSEAVSKALSERLVPGF